LSAIRYPLSELGDVRGEMSDGRIARWSDREVSAERGMPMGHRRTAVPLFSGLAELGAVRRSQCRICAQLAELHAVVRLGDVAAHRDCAVALEQEEVSAVRHGVSYEFSKLA